VGESVDRSRCGRFVPGSGSRRAAGGFLDRSVGAMASHGQGRSPLKRWRRQPVRGAVRGSVVPGMAMEESVGREGHMAQALGSVRPQT